MGRWLTRAPMGYAGGINPYAYCDNYPVNGIHPLGLSTVNLFGENYEFTDEGVAKGLSTGLAGVGSTFTFGA